MGRPTKYNSERAATILEGLEAGMTRRAACGNAGIHEDTFYTWLRQKSSFSALVREAENKAEAKFIRVIEKAAFGHEVVRTRETTRPVVVKTIDENGSKQEHVEHVTEVMTETHWEYDWNAARFWLSRRHRADWGDSMHVELDKEIRELLGELLSLSGTEGHELSDDTPDDRNGRPLHESAKLCSTTVTKGDY